MFVASAVAAVLVLVPPQEAGQAGTSPAPAAPERQVEATFDGLTRFRDAVTEVRAAALNARTPGFEAAVAALEPAAARATDAADMLPIYRDLLRALRDRHSFVQAPPELVDVWTARSGEPLYAPSMGARWTSTLVGRPVSSRLEAGSGSALQIVVVPAMEGGGRRGNANAQALYDVVARDREQACGAVIDLRGNTGGNAWTMLLGLSPLIGGGDLGRSIDAAGVSSVYARSEDGAVIVLEGEYAGQAAARLASSSMWEPYERPIAVLIDDATASSGEQVALELIGRENIRLFGQKTYGVASSNRGILVADDVNLVVTAAWMQDAGGRTWPDGVVPDVVVDGGEEAVLDAALMWLADHGRCRLAAVADVIP